MTAPITAYTLTLTHPIEADSADALLMMATLAMIRGVADVTPVADGAAVPDAVPVSVRLYLGIAIEMEAYENGKGRQYYAAKAWLQTQKPGAKG